MVNLESDIWIFTSGYNLSVENSHRLKRAGVTGVLISVDHYLPESHNKFRGSSKAYKWALSATQNAYDSKLAIAWSLCATKSFVNNENLLNYVTLASQNNVSFIQFLEPMDSGHYSGKKVQLPREQRMILEDFYCRANADPKFRHLPIISYPGYHQRRSGCFGAGNRYLYIDTDGFVHSCPFCRNQEKYHILKEPVNNILAKIETSGCQRFKQATY